jgi:predicted house-cleaning noncanonical NTP pyrophosphatase (MazG superfamily)
VFNRNRIFIYTQDDLERIPFENGKTLEGTVLRLTPRPELLRDSEFLETIAEKAKKHDIPVELQGSILQHAYYQLKQLGVKIQCVDFFTPVFSIQQFGKLVRDQIPIRIRKSGEHVYTIALTGDDLNKVLKAKVVEEALELQSATNVADIEEEVGDVLDVILSLAERMGFSIEEINKKIELKRKERGGFREGLILAETQEVPLIDIDRGTSQSMQQGGKARLPLLDVEGGIARITTRRVPQRQDGNKITIPLIPPDIREAALKLEDLGIVLKIRYEDKEVVLHWGPEAPQVPREQLRLPGL